MKGGKKDKLSLKKANKASKEEMLKQVLKLPVDLNETSDFKQPARPKDQPVWKLEASSTNLSSRDCTSATCESLQTSRSNVGACHDLLSSPRSAELGMNCGEGGLENLRKQTCPLCTSVFQEEELQQHISNCMKSQFRYRKNGRNDASKS